MTSGLPARLTGLLGGGVTRLDDLGASHEWTLHKAMLADGRTAFVKASARSGGVFAAEAAGLRWLGEATGAPVPEVLAVDEATLVLDWLPAESATPQAAERFGRELAAIHGTGADAFGAPWPGFIAELPLDNTPADAWPEWYATRRLLPFLRSAGGALEPEDVRLVERVIDDIEALAGPAEPPARIHGDLWSGNVLWSGGRGWLIDPAAHGGHRETDLAMLALFGTPHLDRIIAAYQEVAPLADGWRSRVPLHQLHPLLVHVVLYGASYRAGTIEAARAALAAAG
ncbi:MAG TPA: fructosamine kinase family protein [Streptosporangiaceae bacterium]|nr:fructosamine kinase family protein [Streptosporangiaceae bacterium]